MFIIFSCITNHTHLSGTRCLISPFLWVGAGSSGSGSPTGGMESRGRPGCGHLRAPRADLFPSSLKRLTVASGPHWLMPATRRGHGAAHNVAAAFLRARATDSKTEVTAGEVTAQHSATFHLLEVSHGSSPYSRAGHGRARPQAAGVVRPFLVPPPPELVIPSPARPSDATSKAKVNRKPGNTDSLFPTRFQTEDVLDIRC